MSTFLPRKLLGGGNIRLKPLIDGPIGAFRTQMTCGHWRSRGWISLDYTLDEQNLGVFEWV